jgi:hypothetical protein
MPKADIDSTFNSCLIPYLFHIFCCICCVFCIIVLRGDFLQSRVFGAQNQSDCRNAEKLEGDRTMPGNMAASFRVEECVVRK